MGEKLAIHGGSPTFPDGPPGWPIQDEAIAEALAQLAADGGWGRYHGPHTEALCEQIASYQNVAHVRLYCSGTIAVEAALRAVGVGAGDRVLLAGYDFPGNFRAVEAIGARPVLVEPSLQNWSFDPAALEKASRFQPKAAIVSHLHGGLAPMRSIRETADRTGVAIVEDACQAQGAVVDGRRAGSWGHVGVWSFGGSKLLTSGRGGALFTDDAAIAQRVKLFSERGNDAFPLSEMQAAVLLPQLKQLDARNHRRRESVRRLISLLDKQVWANGVQLDNEQHSFYKLAFRLPASEPAKPMREAYAAAARAEGLALDSGFRGFARRGTARCDHADDLSTSRLLAANTLLLHHPVLLADDSVVDRAAGTFNKIAAGLHEKA